MVTARGDIAPESWPEGERPRPRLPDVAEVLGFVLVVIGFALAWLPLGLIVGGAGVMAASWAKDRP